VAAELTCSPGDPIKPEYSLSPQGIESLFATNCVGHHILVALLLPLLRSTIVQHIAADVRIVITTSSLHAFCRELDFDLLTASTPSKSAYYDGIWRYARSKLANILYTLELSRRLMEEAEKEGRSEDGAGSGPSSRIFVNCFFPGNIATEQMDIWKRYLGGPFGYLFKRFWGVAGQTTLEAATTALFLAASPRVAEGEGMRGEYFIPIAKRGDVSPIAKDKELAIKLWVSC
jgi:NAD(P)-dependent dehydrogenase (short-subunit alcohol dehydrogenase family)